MSQLSQKTNQFNLTTKRYTEGDIQNFINHPDSDVYALSVSDKFGDSGVTGLCIITSNGSNKTVEIDTLLISCRVIGRNVEYVFINYIIEKIKEKKIIDLKAKYIKTQKNEHANYFFDRCLFNLIDGDDLVRNYTLSVNTYNPEKLDYIKVINED